MVRNIHNNIYGRELLEGGAGGEREDKEEEPGGSGKCIVKKVAHVLWEYQQSNGQQVQGSYT